MTAASGRDLPSAEAGSSLAVVYDALVSHGSRWGGGEDWTCPAHDDHRPSLGVCLGSKTGKVLLNCGKCPPEKVVAALGLTMDDLKPRSTRRRKVASWTYTDEAGRPLYRVDRIVNPDGGKDYVQVPLDPDGTVRRTGKGSMTGTRLVLLNLPAVLETCGAGGHIVITEGEKAADAVNGRKLRRQPGLGRPWATTAPGGAKRKWLDSFTESLRGAGLVTVIADRDADGYGHALKVFDALSTAGMPVEVRRSKTTGAKHDVVDHFAAGHRWADLVTVARDELTRLTESEGERTPGRGFVLRPASQIRAQGVTWQLDGLIPRGELTVLAGREGTGKSTWIYEHVANTTRGKAAGSDLGTPRPVLVVATEDSWAHTVKPRLVAAGADLDRVMEFAVVDDDGREDAPSLADRVDLDLLAEAVAGSGAALVVLDPLMSRIGNKDTHKDAEVRSVLEPLVRVAHDTGCAVLGIIHVNKSGSGDPLTSVMGSRAFTAVPRSVLFVMADPKDEGLRLFGQAKSNLGPEMPGVRSFRVQTATVEVDGLAVETSRVAWVGQQARTLRQAVAEAVSASRGPNKTEQAAEWVVAYLRAHGGRVESSQLKDDARAAGHSEAAVLRARRDVLSDVVTVERRAERHGRSEWVLIDADDGAGNGRFEVVEMVESRPTRPRARGESE